MEQLNKVGTVTMVERLDIAGETGTTPGALEPAATPETDVSLTLTQSFGVSATATVTPASGKIYDNEDAEYSETGAGWSDVVVAGGNGVDINSDWTLGTTHAAAAGSSRLGIIAASVEDARADFTVDTWGGRAVTVLFNDVIGVSRENRLIVAYLKEAEIAQMSGSTIVTSGDSVDSICSAFYEDCSQSNPFPSSCSNKTDTEDTTISCSGSISVGTDEGAFIAVTSGASENVSTWTSGFDEKIDDDTSGQSLAVANRPSGASATPTATATFPVNIGRKVIFSASIGTSGEANPNYYSTSARQHAAGSGSNYAEFAITNIPASMDLLRVFAWWPTVAGAATDTDFEITGKYSATATVDQSTNQGQWNLIQTFGSSASGTTLNIRIDDDANGIVLADAIKLVWTEFLGDVSCELIVSMGLGADAELSTTPGEASPKSITSCVLFLN